jgi:2,4-dienoyl-CoA reductase (NADPH2)
VLVVGAGPAGLEAARLLAGRGHHVVLADRADRVGGTLVLAGRTDTVLDQFVGWQARQVAASTAELRLGTDVTPDLVAALDADEIVVATGGTWGGPSVPGIDAHGVLTVDRLAAWLEHDDATVAPAVVVLGGGKAGLSLARLCAERGRQVTVVEAGTVLAPQLGPPGRFRLVHDVEQAGVTLVTEATVVEITVGTPAGGVQWELADGTPGSAPCGTVILAGSTAAPAAAEPFRALGHPVHVIGDAAAPAGLEGALAGARAVALALD